MNLKASEIHHRAREGLILTDGGKECQIYNLF